MSCYEGLPKLSGLASAQFIGLPSLPRVTLIIKGSRILAALTSLDSLVLVALLLFTPNDLHQHALAPAPIELSIEDLLPGAEIQPPFGHCHDDLPPHDLPLDVRIGVILPGVIARVSAYRLVWCDLL